MAAGCQQFGAPWDIPLGEAEGRGSVEHRRSAYNVDHDGRDNRHGRGARRLAVQDKSLEAGESGRIVPDHSAAGSARLQEQARERGVDDGRLWFGVTRLTGPGGNSSALVGTPEQVARALVRYREVGVDTVLIRGFDSLGDVIDWGRELTPRIHDLAETIPAGGSRA
jgi:alkanesulfonate monooxygenase SsuD/methylene tetrahydromethanopterin reductase-like flavin-dependent oxidoreductase (luciferase family)